MRREGTMNERCDTMDEVLATPPGTTGRHGNAMKRPYAPPRVERLMETSRGTAASKDIHPTEFSDSAGPS
jgi:hypothetical protein